MICFLSAGKRDPFGHIGFDFTFRRRKNDLRVERDQAGRHVERGSNPTSETVGFAFGGEHQAAAHPVEQALPERQPAAWTGQGQGQDEGERGQDKRQVAQRQTGRG